MGLTASRIAAATVLGSAIGALSFAMVSHARELRILRTAVLDPDSPVPGLLLAGLPLGPDVAPRAAAKSRARALLSVRCRLTPTGTTARLEHTLGELGTRVDVDAVVRRAMSVGHRGPLWVRYADRLLADRGAIDVPLAIEVEPAVLTGSLLPLKDATDERPLPARFDFGANQVIAHRAGGALDVEGASDVLRDVAVARSRARMDGRAPGHTDAATPACLVELPRVPLLPTVAASDVPRRAPAHAVSEYETTFAFEGADGPRARNVAVAAAHLDGVVLPPGEIVSFNAVVGPRSEANGFARAFQIYKGEMVEGVGGGTCQVSSTLHAAAMYGGLDIVERAPHSRPLGYVPLGLDATVVYPEVDLKIRNPWSFPMLVHATVTPGRLRVQLLGEGHIGAVTVWRETLKVEPFTRKIEVHPELPEGKYRRKQKGIRGYDVRVTRSTKRLLEGPFVERSVDRYPATPELYWIAPGLDVEGVLPPPPEGSAVSAEQPSEVASEDSPTRVN